MTPSPSARMDSPPRARIARRSKRYETLPAGVSPIGRGDLSPPSGHCPVSSGLPRATVTFPPMLDLPRRATVGGFSRPSRAVFRFDYRIQYRMSPPFHVQLHYEEATEWFRSIGNTLIREHNDRITGQSVLPFTGMRRAK